jgi:hypothetical protein
MMGRGSATGGTMEVRAVHRTPGTSPSGRPPRRAPLVTCLAVALSLVPVAAAPFYEPDGFRGLTWGTSSAQGEQTLRTLHAKRVFVGDEPVCERAPAAAGVAEQVVCTAQTDIGTVRAKVYFEFVEDRFVTVTLLTTPDRYVELRRSFVERYGPPTRAETKKRSGPFSEHSSEEVVWEGPTVRIKLAQYVGGRTLTVAVIGLRSATDSQPVEPESSGAPAGKK